MDHNVPKTPEGVRLVPCTPAYTSAVKVLVLANQEELGFSYDSSLDADLDDIAGTYHDPGGFWVAVVGAQVVGTCGLLQEDEHTARVKRLHVAPVYRGRRIGLALLDYVVGTARRRGFRQLVLDTTPRQLRAIRLYRRFGFQLVDEDRSMMTFKFWL